MIDQISNGNFTAKLVSEQPKVVFKSETDEILRITHEGDIYLHGRKIETDDEIREGLREWLASMGFSRIKAERDKLAEFAREIIRGVWDEGDWGGAEVQELAEKYGLIEPVQYDPEKHGDDYLAKMEPGDTLYVFTDVLKEG